MSNIPAVTERSTGVVSCHCQVVWGRGTQRARAPAAAGTAAATSADASTARLRGPSCTPRRYADSAADAAVRQAAAGALELDDLGVLAADAVLRALVVAEELLEVAQSADRVGRQLARQRDGRGLRLARGRAPHQQPERLGLVGADRAPGHDQLLGLREPDERHQPRRPDGHAEPCAGPHEGHVVAADAQVAAGRELGARPDDVADADGDRGRRERLDRRVQPGERLHPRYARGGVELLGDVGARAQRALGRRGHHEHPQRLVGGQLGEPVGELAEHRAVHRVADLRTVEAQHLDPVAEALSGQCRHPPAFNTMPVMRRLTTTLLTSLALLAVLAPSALAQASGEGTYGPADDKVVTNAGFIVIGGIPLIILLISLLQARLERRQDRKKKAVKAAGGDRRWQGGW